MKSKLKFSIILLLSFILMFNTSVFAVSSNLTSSQKQTIENYIERVNLIQNSIYTLAQLITFPSSDHISLINTSINETRSDLDEMSLDVNKSLDNAPSNTTLHRNLLILSNAINYIKASLHELELLTTQTTPPEKMLTLERYFNFRVYANNSIRFIDNLQSRR